MKFYIDSYNIYQRVKMKRYISYGELNTFLKTQTKSYNKHHNTQNLEKNYGDIVNQKLEIKTAK